MTVPDFPEARHPLIEALSTWSDRQLLEAFQRHPDQGKYFTALFCRYAGLSYILMRNKAPIALQTDYLFAKVWRDIFLELNHIPVEDGDNARQDDGFSLQSWVFAKTALCINQDEAPALENIQYSLEIAAPPLWCYVQRALDYLSPVDRLLILLSHTFHWSEHRIIAFLQAEGEKIERDMLPGAIAAANTRFLEKLPDDIQGIYLQAQ
jgi:hypothetical protein